MQEDDIVTSYKMNRLSIHDSNDNILIDEQSSDEYLWVPPGLDKTMVCEKFLFGFVNAKIPVLVFSHYCQDEVLMVSQIFLTHFSPISHFYTP